MREFMNIVEGAIPSITESNADFVSRPPPDDSAFCEWFADSKIVDHAGRPLLVFHGTEHDLEGGKLRGDIIFFSDNPQTAYEYGRRYLHAAYLRMRKPFDPLHFVRDAGEGKVFYDYLRSLRGIDPDRYFSNIVANSAWDYIERPEVLSWVRQHYDGFVAWEGGGTTYAVFSPEQIWAAAMTQEWEETDVEDWS